MSVEVRPVGSRQELREFIELPFRLHRTSPQWTPPLRIERHAFLSRRLNAFFREGDARLFLARRGERVVGRITAHVDPPFNAAGGHRWGLFGFLELEDDPEVLHALLRATEGWLRPRGRDRLVGPVDFRVNDEAGVLVEGFEREPVIRQAWHPPHYVRLCEGAGLTKAKDLLFWEVVIEDRERIDPRVVRLAERARDRDGLVIRHVTHRTLRADLDRLAEIYHAAWAGDWGFVPYSKADLDQAALEMHLVFDSRWAMVAERDGETVGMALTFPDANQVLRRMGGRLLPLGWTHLLRRGRLIDRVRVGFLGVKPEFQGTGAAAALYLRHFEMAAVTPHKRAEMGWVREDNLHMNRALEGLGARAVKRFRVFERPLPA